MTTETRKLLECPVCHKTDGFRADLVTEDVDVTIDAEGTMEMGSVFSDYGQEIADYERCYCMNCHNRLRVKPVSLESSHFELVIDKQQV